MPDSALNHDQGSEIIWIALLYLLFIRDSINVTIGGFFILGSTRHSIQYLF